MSEIKTFKIDAAGQSLGRVASQAAVILQGKNSANFARHLVANQRVEIINASKLKLTERKTRMTARARYSGYPGGLKMVSWQAMIAAKGYAEPLRLAILGMLPHNKLSSRLAKQLKISE